MKQHVVRWTAWAAVVVSGVFAAAQIQRNFLSPASAQTPAADRKADEPTLAPPAVGFGESGDEAVAPTPLAPAATSPFGAVTPYGAPSEPISATPTHSAYALPSQSEYASTPAANDGATEAATAPATTFAPRPGYGLEPTPANSPTPAAADEPTPAAPNWKLGAPTPAASAYAPPSASDAEAGATNAAPSAAAASPFDAVDASGAPSVVAPPLEAAPLGSPFGSTAEPATLPTGADASASPLSEFTPVETAPTDAFGGPGSANAGDPNRVPPGDPLNRAKLPPRGQGEPGPRELEGPQLPQLTVEKIMPREIQVGAPTLVEIVVRNVGNIPAHRVEVLDSVPRNTELIDAAPHAEADAQGDLVWRLGTLQPQDEGIIRMRVRPLAEGPIGSTAIVSFAVEATARGMATRPVLQVTQTAPKQVMIDDDVVIKIRITNAGTGVARGVVLREKMPPGLRHPSGDELEYPVGDLKPGETATLDLALRAVEPGVSLNELVAYADGELESDPSRCEIAVTSPELDLQLDGPSRRFLERPATYTVALANPGTAPAEEVGLVVKIPTGFDFVKADGQGRWDEATRTVSWLLAELPAGRTTSTTFTVMPTQVGSPALVAEATAERGLAVRKERQTTVEGVVALTFHVVDTADPIQVGEETSYEIHVVNQGSKISKNVRVAVDLPQSMKLVAAEGETAHRDNGGRIIFDALDSLSPKTEAVYRLRVQGLAAGDLRFRAQVLSDEMEKPVTKEESTQVFAAEP